MRKIKLNKGKMGEKNIERMVEMAGRIFTLLQKAREYDATPLVAVVHPSLLLVLDLVFHCMHLLFRCTSSTHPPIWIYTSDLQ